MNLLHYSIATLSLMSAACGEAATTYSPATATTILLDSCSQSASLTPSYRVRQGQQLQGLTGVDFAVQGARFGCQSVSGLALSAGSLVGIAGGQPRAGTSFAGAALSVVDTNGVRGEVAVTRVESDPLDASGETELYTLEALDPSTGAPRNLCIPDSEGRAVAIPLRGSWDKSGVNHADGSLSFYCTSGAVAKCVRWGYRPWSSRNGENLASYHQACTRMARADYCGDGQTRTEEGTEIDLYDRLGINTPSQSLSLLFEAAWTPQGAYCLSRERWLSLANILTGSCKAQFELLPQPSPMNVADLCLVHRIGAARSEVLLSNRAGINLDLDINL